SDDAGASEPKAPQDAAAQSAVEADAPVPDAIAPKPAAKTANKRRSLLMTSAAVGVTLMAAAGVFLISPYNHIIPLNLAALQGNLTAPPGATQSITIPAPIAPSAKLARAPSPQPPPAPNRPIVSSRPRADEMREIVNLRPGSATREAPTSDKPAEDRQAAAPAAPSAAVASVEAPAAQLPITLQPAAAPMVPPAPVLQPVSARPTVTAPAPTDPVVVAATLQASPMSTPQQVDVLNVVTELGTLLRNQRAENAQLREDVQQMRERLDTQLNDYARRLSLAEARGAINAAMGAGTPAANQPAGLMPASITVMAPISSPVLALRGSRVAVPPVLATSPVPVAAQDAPRRYRVQAASPGLAMLAEVDRTGDAGNLLQVSIGDDVPGYGKVKSIAQQGAAWVLTAERGTIR
ncbi:MAG: PspA/IM30 family protein, partial [Janthinobacterium lividum]